MRQWPWGLGNGCSTSVCSVPSNSVRIAVAVECSMIHAKLPPVSAGCINARQQTVARRQKQRQLLERSSAILGAAPAVVMLCSASRPVSLPSALLRVLALCAGIQPAPRQEGLVPPQVGTLQPVEQPQQLQATGDSVQSCRLSLSAKAINALAVAAAIDLANKNACRVRKGSHRC